MKKILVITMLLLLIPSTVKAVSQQQTIIPANIKIFINGQQKDFSEKPIITNDTILLPLGEIAELLGATVEWDGKVIIKKNNKELSFFINSKEVLMGRQIFFMEQIPVLKNGHTMVSLRFINQVLGADINRNKDNTEVNIVPNGSFAELSPREGEAYADNYYKWYDIIIGDVGYSPIPEEARDYVLKQGLLNEITDVDYEPGRYFTTVMGFDGNKQEKLIWLSKNQYIGEIDIVGSVLKNSGLSQDKVLSILREKGIDQTEIKELYINPSFYDQIVWFALAEKDNKYYSYWLNFFTGSVVEESISDKDE